MSRGTDILSDMIASAISSLTDRLGRAPNVSELAGEIGVDREEVLEKLIGGIPFQRAFDTRFVVEAGHPEQTENIDQLQRELSELVNTERLSSLLDAMPDDERAVVVLRLSKLLSQSRIAEVLGVSPGSVARTLAKSLTYLRENL